MRNVITLQKNSHNKQFRNLHTMQLCYIKMYKDESSYAMNEIFNPMFKSTVTSITLSHTRRSLQLCDNTYLSI